MTVKEELELDQLAEKTVLDLVKHDDTLMTVAKDTVKMLWEEQEANKFKWIDINDKKPHAYQTGDWDGKKSDPVLAINKNNTPYVVVLYSGFMDGSEFNNFYTIDDYEIDSITHWMPIPE